MNDGSNDRKGLPAQARLYDLDYVPCPTPSSATGTDRFERDLFTSDATAPKNTARWIVELPLAAVRTAFESAPGAGNGDASDRIVAIETRIGADLTTGTMWPVARSPPNLSRTYAYFYADAADLPYTERYQFVGDPRHSPVRRHGSDGNDGGQRIQLVLRRLQRRPYDAQGDWLAFDASRLRTRWKGRCAHDVPRLLAWLRTALVQTEAVYTTLTGFSYYYLSIGGDVGYDSANGFPNSIPMDGAPFGLAGDVFENTITDGNGHGVDPRLAASTCGATTASNASHPLRRVLVVEALDRRALPGRRVRRAVAALGQPPGRGSGLRRLDERVPPHPARRRSRRRSCPRGTDTRERRTRA